MQPDYGRDAVGSGRDLRKSYLRRYGLAPVEGGTLVYMFPGRNQERGLGALYRNSDITRTYARRLSVLYLVALIYTRIGLVGEPAKIGRNNDVLGSSFSDAVHILWEVIGQGQDGVYYLLNTTRPHSFYSGLISHLINTLESPLANRSGARRSGKKGRTATFTRKEDVAALQARVLAHVEYEKSTAIEHRDLALARDLMSPKQAVAVDLPSRLEMVRAHAKKRGFTFGGREVLDMAMYDDDIEGTRRPIEPDDWNNAFFSGQPPEAVIRPDPSVKALLVIGGVEQNPGPTGETYSKAEAARMLGVPINSNRHAVISAYRRASLRLHPDKGGTAEAFQDLRLARDALLHKQATRTRSVFTKFSDGLEIGIAYGLNSRSCVTRVLSDVRCSETMSKTDVMEVMADYLVVPTATGLKVCSTPQHFHLYSHIQDRDKRLVALRKALTAASESAPFTRADLGEARRVIHKLDCGENGQATIAAITKFCQRYCASAQDRMVAAVAHALNQKSHDYAANMHKKKFVRENLRKGARQVMDLAEERHDDPVTSEARKFCSMAPSKRADRFDSLPVDVMAAVVVVSVREFGGLLEGDVLRLGRLSHKPAALALTAARNKLLMLPSGASNMPRLSQLASSHGEITEGDDVMSIQEARQLIKNLGFDPARNITADKYARLHLNEQGYRSLNYAMELLGIEVVQKHATQRVITFRAIGALKAECVAEEQAIEVEEAESFGRISIERDFNVSIEPANIQQALFTQSRLALQGQHLYGVERLRNEFDRGLKLLLLYNQLPQISDGNGPLDAIRLEEIECRHILERLRIAQLSLITSKYGVPGEEEGRAGIEHQWRLSLVAIDTSSAYIAHYQEACGLCYSEWYALSSITTSEWFAETLLSQFTRTLVVEKSLLNVTASRTAHNRIPSTARSWCDETPAHVYATSVAGELISIQDVYEQHLSGVSTTAFHTLSLARRYVQPLAGHSTVQTALNAVSAICVGATLAMPALSLPAAIAMKALAVAKAASMTAGAASTALMAADYSATVIDKYTSNVRVTSQAASRYHTEGYDVYLCYEVNVDMKLLADGRDYLRRDIPIAERDPNYRYVFVIRRQIRPYSLLFSVEDSVIFEGLVNVTQVRANIPSCDTLRMKDVTAAAIIANTRVSADKKCNMAGELGHMVKNNSLMYAKVLLAEAACRNFQALNSAPTITVA